MTNQGIAAIKSFGVRRMCWLLVSYEVQRLAVETIYLLETSQLGSLLALPEPGLAEYLFPWSNVNGYNLAKNTSEGYLLFKNFASRQTMQDSSKLSVNILHSEQSSLYLKLR